MLPSRIFSDKSVSIAVDTDTGRVRPINEDDVALVRCGDPDLPWAVGCIVADGVGGAGAGEMASRTAVDTLVARLGRWVISSKPAPGWEAGFTKAIKEFVSHAHEVVRERAASDPGLVEMKSTALFALIVRDHAVIGHVGDCRAYLLRDGVLRQLTEDHTVGAQSGRPMRPGQSGAEALAQAIGGRSDVEPDVLFLRLQRGDRLLLCSDGLTKELNEADISQHLTKRQSAPELVRGLIDATLETVARDNISVGVITIDRIPGEGMPVLTTTPDAITGAVAARGVPRRGQRQPQANARRPLIPLVLGAVAITIVIGVSAMLLAATDDRIGGGGVGTGLAGTGTDTPPRTPTQSVEELATGSSSSSDTKTKRPEGGTESNRSGGANLLAKGSETPATSSRRSAPEADGSSKVVSPPAGSEQRGAVVQQVNPTPPPTPPSASAREDRPPPPPVAPRGSNADSAARAVQLNAVTDSIRRKSNEKSQLQRQLAEIEKQITKVDKEDPSGDQKRKLGKLNTDKSAASDRLKSVEAELGRLEERKKQLGGA